MKEVIWLIGNARSGTTWVMNLINHDRKYREVVEPFHPKRVESMNFLQQNLYMRPDSSHNRLAELSEEIFSGGFIHPRVNSGYLGDCNALCQQLLVKDIFANLLSYWVYLRNPDIKVALLIRNPFAVSLSIQKRRDWYFLTDPLDLLHQPNLYKDHLEEFEDIIKKTVLEDDFILCQIIIWCIINYIPLRQFHPGQLHVFFYEDIYRNPNHEIHKLMRFVNLESQTIEVSIERDIIEMPSRFAGPESSILAKKSPITSWKSELTSKQIDAGLGILEQFSLENLYDESVKPNGEVIDGLRDL